MKQGAIRGSGAIRSRSGPTRIRRFLASVVVGAFAFSILEIVGAVSSIAVTLGLMGFDADRAALLSSLVGAAIATSCAALLTTDIPAALTIGISGTAIGFGPTFVAETQTALASRAAFDPIGWAVSVCALVTVAGLVGWASGILGAEIRRLALRVQATLREARHGSGRGRDRWLRPILAIVVVASLVVGLPAFGQMVNYSPDSLMNRGLALNVPLVGAVGSPSPTPSAEPTPTPGPTPAMVAGPVPGSLITAGALSAARPWAAHPPSGSGRLVSRVFPGPWVGGIRSTADVDVYLPPGYGASPENYPTIYFVPWNFATWDDAMHLGSALDALITGGKIPPSIMVFISQAGARYTETECVNSYDSKQWMETYITKTVVPWVDTTYRSIALPSARSLFGYSEGAFCSSMLLARHPELFGSAVALSGYYHAGPRTSETPTAWRVFGGIPALITAYSPVDIIPGLPAKQRAGMFLVVGADPKDPFFGPEYSAMSSVLVHSNLPCALLPSTTSGHSFRAVRDELGVVLELVAARQVELGVFT